MSATPVHGQLKVLACIGNVCLQWALLEQTVLHIISTIEGELYTKTWLKFGGLDMQPRLNMAINLARDAKVPNVIVKRIVAIRTAVQDDLADRRNQAVHGIHKEAEDENSVTLIMGRWQEPKRTQTKTVLDVFLVGREISLLADEAHSVAAAIHEWQMRVLERRLEHERRQLAKRNAPIWFKAGQHLYRRVKRAFRKK